MIKQEIEQIEQIGYFSPFHSSVAKKLLSLFKMLLTPPLSMHLSTEYLPHKGRRNTSSVSWVSSDRTNYKGLPTTDCSYKASANHPIDPVIPPIWSSLPRWAISMSKAQAPASPCTCRGERHLQGGDGDRRCRLPGVEGGLSATVQIFSKMANHIHIPSSKHLLSWIYWWEKNLSAVWSFLLVIRSYAFNVYC